MGIPGRSGCDRLPLVDLTTDEAVLEESGSSQLTTAAQPALAVARSPLWPYPTAS
jgi:hypothetical protein